MPRLPSPSKYSTWQTWASELIATLTGRDQRDAIRLLHVDFDNLPPASEDGLIVFLTNDATGPQPIYSARGKWYRFSCCDLPTEASQQSNVSVPALTLEITYGTLTVEIVGA